METKKKWLKSKTIGFSTLVALLGLAIVALPEFQATVDALPVEYQGYAAVLIAVIIAALRAVTGQPIK